METRFDKVAKNLFSAQSAEDLFKSSKLSGRKIWGIVAGIGGAIGGAIGASLGLDMVEDGDNMVILLIVMLIVCALLVALIFVLIKNAKWPLNVSLNEGELKVFADEVDIAKYLEDSFKNYNGFTYFKFVNGKPVLCDSKVYTSLALSGIEFMYKKAKGKIVFSRTGATNGAIMGTTAVKKLLPFIAEALNSYYEMKTGTSKQIFSFDKSGKVTRA